MPIWHTALVGDGTYCADKISSNLLFGYTKTLLMTVLCVGNTNILSSKGKDRGWKNNMRQRDKDQKIMKKTETASCAV